MPSASAAVQGWEGRLYLTLDVNSPVALSGEQHHSRACGVVPWCRAWSCMFICPQCWENGIILCRELADQYESYYDYRNLSKMRVSFFTVNHFLKTNSSLIHAVMKTFRKITKVTKKMHSQINLCHSGGLMHWPWFSLLDDGSLSLWQDHGPAKTRTRILPSGFLWKEVPFLLAGKKKEKSPQTLRVMNINWNKIIPPLQRRKNFCYKRLLHCEMAFRNSNSVPFTI